ncbi:MAG: tRNA preQ1(34) S-adenosylmethionine ribosyltransferase-isomerase QueA [Burkholderiales bacterium]
MNASDFDFVLPESLIAQAPLAQRRASRLLHLSADLPLDRQFADLANLIAPGDLLVFNDSRVVKARLQGAKQSGGRVEVLIERATGEREALAQVRASKSPRAGSWLMLEPNIPVEVLGREDDLYRLRFATDLPLLELLERHGSVPLPPYIAHQPTPEDESRYQTVYAREPGAVAAPTAGLHFDEAMLTELKARGVRQARLTLHVGAGTFQPVRVENLAEHRMHLERYWLSEETRDTILDTRARGGKIIAVGTTSMRALESAVVGEAGAKFDLRTGPNETRLFILPGFQFQVVDRLLTNFHLPRSTLLMLVSAFAGVEVIQRAYAHAIEKKYRFFSYGDAMLIDRKINR